MRRRNFFNVILCALGFAAAPIPTLPKLACVAPAAAESIDLVYFFTPEGYTVTTTSGELVDWGMYERPPIAVMRWSHNVPPWEYPNI